MIRAFFAALCLLVGAAHAATIDPRNAKYDICGAFELWHINGIMTDPDGAAENVNRIAAVHGNAYNGHLILYRLAYNQTRGLKTDFLDSAKQVISGYAGATWDNWMNAVTFGVYGTLMTTATAQAVAKKVNDLYGFTKPSPYQDADLTDITNKILAGSTWSAHILLAPHSQGNLYANLVYDKLIAAGKPAQSIGVVGLAVPYSSVRTGNVYVTSVNDVVIDSVRVATILLPGFSVLAPNVTIPYAPSVDALGHKLQQTYMADAIARAKYAALITQEFGTLKTVAASPVWAPPYGYDLSVYASVIFSTCPGCIAWNGTTWGPIPDSYHWYSPGTQAYNNVVPGTLAAATTQALANAAQCYSLHIAEVLRRRQLGDFSSWVTIPGCWGMMSRPYAGSWWPYSGDLAPVFRSSYEPSNGQITTTAGATCRR